jgi:hypothetical protein
MYERQCSHKKEYEKMTRNEYLKAAEQWAEAQKEKLGIDGGPEARNIESWAENIAQKQADSESDNDNDNDDHGSFDSADEFKEYLDNLADIVS